MRRSELLTAVLLVLLAAPLFGASAVENATAYTQAARVSLDSGFAETAKEYADTALVYCEASSDAWYLKALAEERLDLTKPVTETIETLSHAFDGGAFFTNESDFDARMWMAQLCLSTGKYQKAADILTGNPAITEDKLLLLTKIWYALGDGEKARDCVETGVQMYPLDWEFYCLFFMNEDPSDARETPLCARLTANVGLFDPTASDIYLYASPFVDEETSSRYIRMYGQYRGINPLYPIYALEKGFMHFDEALYLFDALCHDGMRYDQLERLCGLAEEDDLIYLYTFLDGFNGVIFFSTDETRLLDMNCSYRYGRPYTVYYDKSCDNAVEMLITCDYGTPVFVYMPSADVSLSYNRYPSVTHVTFSEPAVSLDFARNACAWKAVAMEKASFSTADFAFYVPVLEDALEEVDPASFIQGCSVIECTTEDPEGCAIRIIMNGGKPVDAFYTVRGKLYAHAYFTEGKLQYRDVDMDGDGLFELSEQYLYDADEPDPVLIGNRIYGTVADCFEIPRFSVLLSDGDEDGVYEYEEIMNLDGTSEKTWF